MEIKLKYTVGHIDFDTEEEANNYISNWQIQKKAKKSKELEERFKEMVGSFVYYGDPLLKELNIQDSESRDFILELYQLCQKYEELWEN